MVGYAKERGVIDVQFNTNGMLLTGETAEALIKSGLDRLIVSLDGTTKETFEAIRGGAVFETVVNNLLNFVKIRNRIGLRKPFVRVQMTKSEQNEGEVDDYIAMWRDVVNKISFNVRRDPILTDGYNHGAVKHFPCNQIWQRMVVLWDGDVIMCCGDWHKEYVLGNAYKDNLYDLWHGKKYNYIREMHKHKRFDDVPLCKKCEYNIARSDNQLNTIRHDFCVNGRE